MKLMSQVMDEYFCNAGVSREPDYQVAFGCYIHNVPCGVVDPTTLSRYEKEKAAVFAMYPNIPLGPEDIEFDLGGETFVDDLYIPGHQRSDKRLNFWFPGIGKNFISSAQLAKDIRFLLLAWPVVMTEPGIENVTFELLYSSGHKVVAAVDVDVFRVIKNSVELLSKRTKVETPGKMCHRCTRMHECKAMDSWQEDNHVKGKQPREDMAHKLIFDRMDVMSRMEVLDHRKKEIDGQLKAMLEDEDTRIGDILAIDSRTSKTSAYPDFEQVFDLLAQAGLWNPKFAKVQAGPLNIAMKAFPSVIKAALELLKVTTEKEPGLLIKEAIDARRTEVPKNFLRGKA